MIEILPTCVPRDPSEIVSAVEVVREFATGIHIDIDDGILAPHLTWPYSRSGEYADVHLPPLEGLVAEIHIMADRPREVGEAFARAGAHRIIGHIEGFEDEEGARAALQAWKEAGAKDAGIGLLFDTPPSSIAPLMDTCDSIHTMSIASIGTQGIPYEASSPQRIAEVHEMFPEKPISVDGGISPDNIAQLVRAGATRFGVGSAIMRSSNPKAAYEELKQLAEEASS
ncbi:MAG: hypothetical protein NUV59_02055 [Patescibacteria group bacterium]|nr:hypothetical protein [Patescibacteria group bacterium]